MILSCLCSSSRPRIYVADAGPSHKVDPTGTSLIRRRYEKDLMRRFRNVRRMIWQAVIELDVLGLKRGDLKGAIESASFARLFANAPMRVRDANPYHVASGEHGGEFTGGSGGDVSDVLKKATQGHGLSSARLTEAEKNKLKTWLGLQPRSMIPVYRGVWLTNDQFAKGPWNEGSTVDFSSLSSFTEDPIRSSAYGSGGDVFIRIDMPAGYTVDISKHSVYPQEQEHVLPSSVSMKVSSRTRQSPGFYVVKLTPSIHDAAPPAKSFAFVRPADKVRGFMNWLDTAVDDEILGIVSGTNMQSAADRAWQNVYIDSAYQKGIRDAAAYVAEQSGISPSEYPIAGSIQTAFNQPVHADRVALVYSRAFRNLEGITDAMDLGISRSLADGIANGLGPQQIARDLVAAVDDIGITRARVLARTEIINAHAEAALNSYDEAGVLGVTAEVEFATAGDDAVCPDCAALEGETYSLEDARGVIPVHPNCRCAWIPVVGEAP